MINIRRKSINQVNVYKTPMASVVGQGIAGTVDLRTIRPLEYGKRVISVGGRVVYPDIGKLNPDAKKYGYRVNGVYVDQFADGRLGMSLAGSWTDEPYEIKEFNAWGYPTPAPAMSIDRRLKAYSTSTELKRLGLAGTVEFKPTDYWTSTVDGFYSNFKDDQIKRGIEIPLCWGGGASSSPASPSTMTSSRQARSTTSTGVVRNVSQPRHAKLYSFGWNNRYDGPQRLARLPRHQLLEDQAQRARVRNLCGHRLQQVRTRATTLGFEVSDTGTVFTSHNLDYSDPNLILLTSPQGWGGPVRPPVPPTPAIGTTASSTTASGNITAKSRRTSTPPSCRRPYWERTGPITTSRSRPTKRSFGSPATTSSQLTLPEQYLNEPGQSWMARAGQQPGLRSAGSARRWNLHIGVDANANLDVVVKAYQIQENLGTVYGVRQHQVGPRFGRAHRQYRRAGGSY